MPIRYVSGDLFDNTHDARVFARAGRHVEVGTISAVVLDPAGVS